MQRFIESESCFEFLDEFGVQTLRTAIFTVRTACRRQRLLSLELIKRLSAAAARYAFRNVPSDAAKIRDDLFDRPTRGNVNHSEVDHHDGEQRWNDEQNPPYDVSGHDRVRAQRFRFTVLPDIPIMNFLAGVSVLSGSFPIPIPAFRLRLQRSSFVPAHLLFVHRTTNVK